MFGSLLCLDAAILFLVQNYHASLTAASQKRQETSSDSKPADLAHSIERALWTASCSLAVTIIAMTSIALLNRPLDPPKTLVINSRLIRIAPRLPATVIIVCLPFIPGVDGSTWCSGAVSLIYCVFLWEWCGGLEKDWKVFESKYE